MHIIIATTTTKPKQLSVFTFQLELEGIFKYYKYQQCHQQLQAGFLASSLRLLGGGTSRARKSNNSSPQNSA